MPPQKGYRCENSGCGRVVRELFEVDTNDGTKYYCLFCALLETWKRVVEEGILADPENIDYNALTVAKDYRVMENLYLKTPVQSLGWIVHRAWNDNSFISEEEFEKQLEGRKTELKDLIDIFERIEYLERVEQDDKKGWKIAPFIMDMARAYRASRNPRAMEDMREQLYGLLFHELIMRDYKGVKNYLKVIVAIASACVDQGTGEIKKREIARKDVVNIAAEVARWKPLRTEDEMDKWLGMHIWADPEKKIVKDVVFRGDDFHLIVKEEHLLICQRAVERRNELPRYRADEVYRMRKGGS